MNKKNDKDIIYGLIEQVVLFYSQNDTESCRECLNEYFDLCSEEKNVVYPNDFKENPSLWYEIMIDTNLYHTPSGSFPRSFFEKAAKYKFDEIPEEFRQKFIDGLDEFFPASDD